MFGALPFGAQDDRMPLSQMKGLHVDFPALVKATAFAGVADDEMCLERLAVLPRRLL